MIKHIILTIAVIISTYLITAFLVLEINPLHWSDWARGLYVLMAIVVVFPANAFLEYYN